MKKIIILFISIVLLFSGCTEDSILSNSNGSSNDKNSVDDNTVINNIDSKKGETMISSNVNSIFCSEIKIYKISRDNFISFVEKPSQNFFKNSDFSAFSFSKGEEWYITSENTRFLIKKKLIDFLGTRNGVEKYLSQNNVNGGIEDIAVFDAPKFPITVWIKTTAENVYITINEKPEDDMYVYRLYTHYEFCEKYLPKQSKLVVEGKEIATKTLPKIYNNYADIPLIAVVEALGAKVVRQDNDITIKFNGKTYLLNINEPTLYVSGNQTENLLYKVDGGATFVYSVGNELMIDNTTLYSVLSDMGKKITIKFDKDNLIVDIKVKQE